MLATNIGTELNSIVSCDMEGSDRVKLAEN